jgi:protein TonB
MSYAQKKELSGNRTLAIVIVAILQFTLGYAIVTGLAYNVIKHAAENLKTFDVEDQPPPPEQPPPPPPKNVPELPPPPVAMKPIVETHIEAAPQIVTVPTPPPIHIQAPPAPPAPPPAKIQRAESARGNLQGLISSDDYPESAIRNNETGRVTVRLSIGTNGRVTGCDVIGSSGSRALDSTTCRVLTSRARFNPARSSDGSPTTDTYTQSIVWQLQG